MASYDFTGIFHNETDAKMEGEGTLNSGTWDRTSPVFPIQPRSEMQFTAYGVS